MPFNEELASRAVTFIESYLRHTTGDFAGKTFTLAPFQRHIVRTIFGTVKDDGFTRQYKTVFVSLPRKNGKTGLMTAIALYQLFCEKEIGGQIVSASYTRKQASIIFEEATKMIRQNPDLYKRVEIKDSYRQLRRPKYGIVYQSLSSDAHAHHGMNPSGVYVDEVAELRNMDLWNVLTTGSGVRRQPLFFGIGTAGEINSSPVAEYLWDRADKIKKGIYQDDTFLPVIYTIPEGSDWRDEAAWYEANPALQEGFLNITDLRDHYNNALRMPEDEVSFKRFKLNIWVQQTHAWIPLHEFDACKIERFDEAALKELPCYIGVDLSAQNDLTAVCCVWVAPDRLYVRHRYFYPADELKEKSAKSGIPFDRWAEKGFLTVTPGRTVNYDAVFDHIKALKIQYKIQEICFDPAMAHNMMERLSGEGFTVVKVYNSWKMMTPACRELERRVLDRTIHHEGHPITRFCIDSCAVKTDRNENIVPVKPDRMKASKRIDGVAAMLSALARIATLSTPEVKPSVYQERGLLVL